MGKISKLLGVTAAFGAAVCGVAYYKKKSGMQITGDEDFEDDMNITSSKDKKVIDVSTEGSDDENKKVTITFNKDKAKQVVSDTLDTIGDAMYTAKDKIIDTIGEDNVEDAKESVEKVKDKLVDTIGEDNLNKAKSTINKVTDKAKEKADEIFTEENIEMAKDKASDAFDKTKDALKKATDKVKSMKKKEDEDDVACASVDDSSLSEDTVSENNAVSKDSIDDDTITEQDNTPPSNSIIDKDETISSPITNENSIDTEEPVDTTSDSPLEDEIGEVPEAFAPEHNYYAPKFDFLAEDPIEKTVDFNENIDVAKKIEDSENMDAVINNELDDLDLTEDIEALNKLEGLDTKTTLEPSDIFDDELLSEPLEENTSKEEPVSMEPESVTSDFSTEAPKKSSTSRYDFLADELDDL